MNTLTLENANLPILKLDDLLEFSFKDGEEKFYAVIVSTTIPNSKVQEVGFQFISFINMEEKLNFIKNKRIFKFPLKGYSFEKISKLYLGSEQ